jgi:hypothetical protein
MARRWVCPVCGGGVNGPDRPRRDDVRRWCLRCSETTGRLVERSSPALERQREQAKTKRAERTAKQRERARVTRAQREIIDGVDVGKEIARLVRLPALRDELPSRMRGRKVDWTLHRTDNGSYSGRAWPRSRIHLSLGDIPAAEVKMITCHELAHYALPTAKHTDRWARCYARLVREAYGVDVQARPGESKYALDRRVTQALGGNGRVWIEEDD